MPRSNEQAKRYRIKPLEWTVIDNADGLRIFAADFEIWEAFNGRQVWRFWNPANRRQICESKTLDGAKRMAERIHHKRLMKWLEEAK